MVVGGGYCVLHGLCSPRVGGLVQAPRAAHISQTRPSLATSDTRDQLKVSFSMSLSFEPRVTFESPGLS